MHWKWVTPAKLIVVFIFGSYHFIRIDSRTLRFHFSFQIFSGFVYVKSAKPNCFGVVRIEVSGVEMRTGKIPRKVQIERYRNVDGWNMLTDQASMKIRILEGWSYPHLILTHPFLFQSQDAKYKLEDKTRISLSWFYPLLVFLYLTCTWNVLHGTMNMTIDYWLPTIGCVVGC